MSIQRATPVNEFIAKLIFLILPTAGIGYFLLDNLNQYYSILQNQAFSQSLYFLGAMAVSSLFYSFRFRFLPLFVILIFIFYSVYTGLDSYAIGEFDAFFIARKFQVFAILFTTGWLIGWGYIRLRYWSVGIAFAILVGCIAVIAKSKVDTVRTLVLSFSPALFFSVYLIFTAEQIYNYKDKSKRFWFYLIGRLFIFSLLAILLLSSVTYLVRDQLKEVVANYGGQGKEGSNEMLKKNKDGTFQLKDLQKLKSSQGRSSELLFCAHMDNFFPGSTEPNPLYLTGFYFTKFDTSTETFERDTIIPFNDLFEPDPSKIPLFSTKSDSSVIENSLGDKYRKIVEIEIYSKSLSPETYLAPNAGFFVQPITIEKDFRQEFKTAFRAKSYVSELNSAYFVYNINKPEWRNFQEMRFQILRKYNDYSTVDSGFMKYYTTMPGSENFKKIGALAHKITDSATTTADKVLAIRDYFLSKDENGDPLYKYTDNPGEPDIPSASKLKYFLFENHKGYCAYFAGATLFMLRSLGIPSRIAVGFLTENRSDKNKGWYWYYAKQAHAWVQVYFPGLGWLDFDTTVGNSDAHESPKPDGTPPMQPPKAWLAANGVVDEIDTVRRIMKFSIKQFVFHDKDYKLKEPLSVKMDMKIALVYRDSMNIPLGSIQKGDEGTVVSYAEAFKNLTANVSETATDLVERFPSPEPIDEVYLKRKDVVAPMINKQKAVEKNDTNKNIVFWIIGFCAAFVLLIIFIPAIYLIYFKIRCKISKQGKEKSYWVYKLTVYYLHMLGIYRGSLTPLQYAKRIIDPTFSLEYEKFMTIYLKNKYNNQQLTVQEIEFVNGYLSKFFLKMRDTQKIGNRVLVNCHLYRFVSYFTIPQDESIE